MEQPRDSNTGKFVKEGRKGTSGASGAPTPRSNGDFDERGKFKAGNSYRFQKGGHSGRN